MIPNRVYDWLKWIGLIALPGTAWFIGQIAPLWEIANADAIVGTLNAAGMLLGILIGVSTVSYNKQA